jgi:hypothetical protein
MLSNLPPGTWEGDPNAPWNQKELPECEFCRCEMEEVDYLLYECKNCGHTYSNEPDYDSMPGGHDDY